MMDCMTGYDWTLVPGVSVGPYRLGRVVSDYPELVGVDLNLPSSVGGGTYVTEDGADDFMVCTDDDGVIIHVDCYAMILFGGVNLIGKTQRQICQILERFPDKIEDQDMGDENQKILCFDRLGVMAWLRSGVVVTVQCSQVYDD